MSLTVRLEDPEATSRLIQSFLRTYLDEAQERNALVGLSGGLDSAVTAALTTRAAGADRTAVVALPAPTRDPQDLHDARSVADHLGLELRVVEIGPILEGLARSLGHPNAAALPQPTRANAAARARMTVLYALAAQENRIVLGTGNKSELLTGYFTKHGDGGVDLLPIGDLYKTQVRSLARHLEIPTRIIEKPPSAGLWEGQTDEGELGIDYDRLDRILLGLELKLPLERIARLVEVPLEEVRRIEHLRRATHHKRRTPMIPRIGARTVGIDWRAPTTEAGP